MGKALRIVEPQSSLPPRPVPQPRTSLLWRHNMPYRVSLRFMLLLQEDLEYYLVGKLSRKNLEKVKTATNRNKDMTFAYMWSDAMAKVFAEIQAFTLSERLPTPESPNSIIYISKSVCCSHTFSLRG